MKKVLVGFAVLAVLTVGIVVMGNQSQVAEDSVKVAYDPGGGVRP
jgi:hypothetical protein